jgi:hypothetical protein
MYLNQWRSQEFTSGWARDYFSIFGWAQTQKFAYQFALM